MDMNNGTLRLTCSKTSDMAAVLRDLEHLTHKPMTESSSYKTALLQKSGEINVNTAAAFQNSVLAALVVQQVQEAKWAVPKSWRMRRRL